MLPASSSIGDRLAIAAVAAGRDGSTTDERSRAGSSANRAPRRPAGRPRQAPPRGRPAFFTTMGPTALTPCPSPRQGSGLLSRTSTSCDTAGRPRGCGCAAFRKRPADSRGPPGEVVLGRLVSRSMKFVYAWESPSSLQAAEPAAAKHVARLSRDRQTRPTAATASGERGTT